MSSTFWLPPSENYISTESFKELRQYAVERGIAISQFKTFDGDVELIKEFINSIYEMKKFFPYVSDEKHQITIIASNYLVDGDLAYTQGRHISINQNAYRDREKLNAFYEKYMSDGWFVQGTTYKAIPFHEFGHIIDNVFKIPALKLACEVMKKETAVTLNFIRKNLSRYAASYVDGTEITSEVLADISSNEPIQFSETYFKILKKYIKNKINSISNRRENKMSTTIKQQHRMSIRNKDAMIWCEKDEWFQIDEKNNRFVLTPNAPQIARDSFEKYKRINNLNWS